jgi:hypothetical protein
MAVAACRVPLSRVSFCRAPLCCVSCLARLPPCPLTCHVVLLVAPHTCLPPHACLLCRCLPVAACLACGVMVVAACAVAARLLRLSLPLSPRGVWAGVGVGVGVGVYPYVHIYYHIVCIPYSRCTNVDNTPVGALHALLALYIHISFIYTYHIYTPTIYIHISI